MSRRCRTCVQSRCCAARAAQAASPRARPAESPSRCAPATSSSPPAESVRSTAARRTHRALAATASLWRLLRAREAKRSRLCSSIPRRSMSPHTPCHSFPKHCAARAPISSMTLAVASCRRRTRSGTSRRATSSRKSSTGSSLRAGTCGSMRRRCATRMWHIRFPMPTGLAGNTASIRIASRSG